MKSSGWYPCKDCQAQFFISDQEIAEDTWLDRKPRQRCDRCVTIHRQRVRVLARANFPIPNASNGDGCFESLTFVDLELPDAPPPASVALPVSNENDSQRVFRYLLLEPAWIHRPAPLQGLTRYPWRSVATTTRVPHPESIRFSVEGQMIGAAHIRRTAEGIMLWWLDSLPQTARYQNAQFALPCYAIAESIRSGDQGRILIRPASHLTDLYESLGCQPTRRGHLLELPREAALLLALRVEGVSFDSAAQLRQLDSTGAVNLAWIVAHLGKGRLKAIEIEAITRLMPDTTWPDIYRLATVPDTMADPASSPIIHNLCNVFGTLAMRNLITRWARRATFAWPDARTATSQQVRLPRRIWIDQRDVDEAAHTITQRKTYLPINATIDIATRIWRPADYETNAGAAIREQIPYLGDYSSHRILAVSNDFDRRPISLRKMLIQSAASQNMQVWVLPFNARAIRRTVQRWLRRLGSTDMQTEA